MTLRDPKLGGRLLIGALAGVAGTIAMMAAIRRFDRYLPPADRDPEQARRVDNLGEPMIGADSGGDGAADSDPTSGNFGYGAVAGSIIAAANPRLGPWAGAAAGIAVWAASYLGLPRGGIVKTSSMQPRRRNAFTLVAHMVWGVATARAMRELLTARDTVLGLVGSDDAREIDDTA